MQETPFARQASKTRAGNLIGFLWGTVRIPTVDEERERAMSRQRQQLMRERQRVAGMGRGLLALHNIHVTGKWWKGKAWAAIKVLAPEWVIEMLEVFSLNFQTFSMRQNK